MHPALEPWLAALRAELAALGREPGAHVAVCHSLACVLWMHHAAREGAARVDRVLLVAPPSEAAGVPEIEPFFPVPTDPALQDAATSTLLVCSDDDPYCPGGAAARYGEPLGIETHVVPGGGHLNPDAGLGPWPSVESWCLEGVWACAPGPGGPGATAP